MADTATKIAALEKHLHGDDPLLERGIGSPYESADAKDKALLEALYALRDAENAVGDAETAHAAAMQKVADAQAAVDALDPPNEPARSRSRNPKQIPKRSRSRMPEA
jgi:hypothetical protein